MFKRTLLTITALFAVLISTGAVLLTGSQLTSVINTILPNGWRADIPQRLETSLEQIRLPHFSLYYADCPLLTTDNLTVAWWHSQSIVLDKGTLDYACLQQLQPSEPSPDPEPLQLNPLLALVPDGEIAINALHWQNLPPELPERLKDLLNSPSQIKITKSGDNLTAQLHQRVIQLSANLQNQQLRAELNYQPNNQEQHKLQLQSELAKDLLAIPNTFEMDYHWQIPTEIIGIAELSEGQAKLNWQQEDERLSGHLSLTSLIEPKNAVNFPLAFDGKTFSIEKGKFDWDWHFMPLNGFLNAQITPSNLTDFFPISTYFRISLLSQGNRGKGNIVLENKDGEIQKNALNLPLRITGEVKKDDFILYSAVPLSLSGQFDDLSLRFLPSSLLRLAGKERYLTIQDLRFPMAGITLNKYGLTGRLHSIFRGESPDFKQAEFHLDGYARNFKFGALDFFEDPPQADAVSDQWNWRFWGNSQIDALKSKVAISGRGNWHEKLIQLSELQGNTEKIKLAGLQIPQLDLNLSEPIKFAYQNFGLTGGISLTAPEIRFDYGGEIPKPIAKLNFNGVTDNLNLKGTLQAEKIAPLKMFARRELTDKESRFLGRLYWLEQPADVFQPLLPFREGWLIKGGTLKGETAFSATDKSGFTAGGHLTIKNGAMTLASGDVQGIEFSLPYRYQRGKFTFGNKKPVALNIREINLGLPIRNVKVNIYGDYPYTRKKPLHLDKLSLNLLGGSLNVKHFALPQTEIAYLNLENIAFEQITELLQYQQIELKGRANATLPFWLSGKPCYVCDGLLTQSEPSNLTFTPEVLEAMKKSGYTEQILMYLMNNTQADELRTLINVGSKGDMVLNAKIRMRLLEQRKAKINLNYNHKENLFDLWKLINYGSEVEQKIENYLYQKLEK